MTPDEARLPDAVTCPGPLIWFDAPPQGAILECAECGYCIVSGSFYDAPHADTDIMREGLAS